jgi:hypothetical protein
MTYVFAALAASFAFIFWKIGKRIAATYRCVSDATLRDYFYGRLKKTPEAQSQVITHLGHCEKCRDRLHLLQRGKPLEDHLVSDE